MKYQQPPRYELELLKNHKPGPLERISHNGLATAERILIKHDLSLFSYQVSYYYYPVYLASLCADPGMLFSVYGSSVARNETIIAVYDDLDKPRVLGKRGKDKRIVIATYEPEDRDYVREYILMSNDQRIWRVGRGLEWARLDALRLRK